jgi:response regulator RpfG family c-di-GMP phosphodiesterase
MKIVLVDDSELDLMINKKIIELTYDESKVASFNNSESFFNYMSSGEKPDMVISDMQMPKVSGLDLAHEYITKYGKDHSKLVLLTAFVDGAIQKQVNDISDHIKLVEKPLNPSVLKALVSA